MHLDLPKIKVRLSTELLDLHFQGYHASRTLSKTNRLCLRSWVQFPRDGAICWEVFIKNTKDIKPKLRSDLIAKPLLLSINRNCKWEKER